MPEPTFIRRTSRLIGALTVAVLATLAAAATVAAVEPSSPAPPPLAADDLGLDGHASWADRVEPAALSRQAPRGRPSSIPAPTPVPTPSSAAATTRAPSSEPTTPGIDVSYPQCGRELPEEFDFAIVGVNGGRVYSANPCLGNAENAEAESQLEWAGRDAELYLNTGNPGPRDSRYWPVGQVEPRACDPADVDSLDCAYTYGWNAAHEAYALALAAYVDLEWTDADADRLPSDVRWWLDVEDANSWRRDYDRNVAALQGMVDALSSLGAEDIGFYSTPRLWDRITGGTDAFAAYPAWHAGASDEADAIARCAEEDAFTGGELRMVQWVEDDLDRNVRCDS